MNRAAPKMSKDNIKEKSSVPSVEKALDILEYLSTSKDGATMNELVEAMQRSMGEIYRIVIYLTERDYLRLDKASSRYSLSLRMFELAHCHDPTEQLIRNSVPLMERFSAFTEQSCHLAVLHRDNVTILASVSSQRPAGYSVRTGAIFPLETTSTGSVIMAFSDDELQQRFLNRLSEPAKKKVEKRLKSIRKTGFEDSPSVIVAGVRNLSVPIFDFKGVRAALACGYIQQMPVNKSPEETLAILNKIGTELSQTLGHNPTSQLS